MNQEDRKEEAKMAGLQDLLASCSKKEHVTFSINEAKLILPIWEAKYPKDNRLRKAMLSIREQTPLSIVAVDEATAYAANNANADPACDAAYAAYAAARAVSSAYAAYAAASTAAHIAYYADWTAYWVRCADPNTLEDQRKRLNRIMLKTVNQEDNTLVESIYDIEPEKENQEDRKEEAKMAGFNNLLDLLTSCSKEECATFSVNEAWLVLPIFEAQHPMDNRLRKAMLSIDAAHNAVAYHAAASVAAAAAAAAGETAAAASTDYHADWAARAAYYVARATAHTAWAAAAAAEAGAGAASTDYHADWAAYWVRCADPNITLEDQRKRLNRIMLKTENQKDNALVESIYDIEPEKENQEDSALVESIYDITLDPEKIEAALIALSSEIGVIKHRLENSEFKVGPETPFMFDRFSGKKLIPIGKVIDGIVECYGGEVNRGEQLSIQVFSASLSETPPTPVVPVNFIRSRAYRDGFNAGKADDSGMAFACTLLLSLLGICIFLCL